MNLRYFRGKQSSASTATLLKINCLSGAEAVSRYDQQAAWVIGAVTKRNDARLMRGADVAATIRVERIATWNVVVEVDELEIFDGHLAVEPAACDRSIHLRCLLGYLAIFALEGPLRPADLFEHVEGIHAHQEVKHGVDHDSHKHQVEVIRIISVPIKISVSKSFFVCRRYPDCNRSLLNGYEKE